MLSFLSKTLGKLKYIIFIKCRYVYQQNITEDVILPWL
jgi:hypothetical protein